MQHTQSVKEFATKNDAELRKIVTSICDKQRVSRHHVEDLVQDVYFRLIKGDVLSRFDPNFGGFKPKISTYLYPMIYNMVTGLRNKNSYKMESGKFHATEDFKEMVGESDDVEIALRCCSLTPEFQSIIDHNSSDDNQGLASELKEFEEKWLSEPSHNRKFSLKYKGKRVGGGSIVDVYRYINYGLTNREIGEIYGVSGAFISTLKQMIIRTLKAYGIEHRSGFKSKNWKQTEDNPVRAVEEIQVVPLPVEKPIGKNGHKHEFRRPMTNAERAKLKKWWLDRSGIVDWDDVRDFRLANFSTDVSAMQVCGFVSSLHKALARGDLEIADRAGYNANRISRGQATIPLKSSSPSMDAVVFTKR